MDILESQESVDTQVRAAALLASQVTRALLGTVESPALVATLLPAAPVVSQVCPAILVSILRCRALVASVVIQASVELAVTLGVRGIQALVDTPLSRGILGSLG